MTGALQALAGRLGFSFSDPDLLRSALTHCSAGAGNNERLEFLGDAILDFVIAEALYERFPGADEGRLSRLRAALVKRDALAAIAREIALGQFLNLGAGELKSGGRSRDSILSDALEAVFAAVHLDGGFECCRSVILALFRERLDALRERPPHKDPKSTLQEYLQSRHLPLPDYRILEVRGAPHVRCFRVACQVRALPGTVVGQGPSRRQAEQDAAGRALVLLDE